MTAPAEASTPRIRMTILFVIIMSLFATLFARLWFLQVVQAHKSQVVAQANGVRTVYTPAPRGNIVDRSGQLLVGNVNEPVIDVSRQVALSYPAMVSRLAVVLGMTVKQLNTAIGNLQYSPYAPVPVRYDASPQQILYIKENQNLFPGVKATTAPVRTYTPMGRAAANIVGYVSQVTPAEYKVLKSKGVLPGQQIGQAGVEATFNNVLMGKPGVEKVQVDSQGNVLGVLSSTPPVQGDTVRLTISGRVQEAAVNALDQEIAIKRTEISSTTGRPYRATGGGAVVEDPNNGSILALATAPDYNPEQFVGGISQANYSALTNPAAHNPLLDRAIAGVYFPGSTFKLVTATAGLKSGIIGPYTYFNDHGGGLTVGGHFFANDGHQSFGLVNLPFALGVSDDAFFYNIGARLNGTTFLQKVAGEYGFGKVPGIQLPGVSPAYILTPNRLLKLHQKYPRAYPHYHWYIGDNVLSAIGQDYVSVTPLQMADAYSTFANGGTRYSPSVVASETTPAGKVVKVFKPKVVTRVPLTPQERASMLKGFEEVTHNPLGTAYGSFGKYKYPINVAGKTGSAQVVFKIPHNSPKYKDLTSVFTSFAPANHPKYVVDCFIAQAGYGAGASAPVTRQIYDVLFHQPILKTPVSGY